MSADPVVDAAAARQWLREPGWEVEVHERNLRPAFEARGLRYADTIDHTHWVDLVSMGNPDFVVKNYGSGLNDLEAVIRAQQRYGSEQT